MSRAANSKSSDDDLHGLNASSPRGVDTQERARGHIFSPYLLHGEWGICRNFYTIALGKAHDPTCMDQISHFFAVSTFAMQSEFTSFGRMFRSDTDDDRRVALH